MNFAFGMPFFPKGTWRAACVEPQRKIESPFCILELECICARQGLPLAVTTSPPQETCGPELCAAPYPGLLKPCRPGSRAQTLLPVEFGLALLFFCLLRYTLVAGAEAPQRSPASGTLCALMWWMLHKPALLQRGGGGCMSGGEAAPVQSHPSPTEPTGSSYPPVTASSTSTRSLLPGDQIRGSPAGQHGMAESPRLSLGSDPRVPQPRTLLRHRLLPLAPWTHSWG